MRHLVWSPRDPANSQSGFSSKWALIACGCAVILQIWCRWTPYFCIFDCCLHSSCFPCQPVHSKYSFRVHHTIEDTSSNHIFYAGIVTSLKGPHLILPNMRKTDFFFSPCFFLCFFNVLRFYFNLFAAKSHVLLIFNK